MKPSIYNFEPRHSGKLIPIRMIICFVLGFIAVYCVIGFFAWVI